LKRWKEQEKRVFSGGEEVTGKIKKHRPEIHPARNSIAPTLPSRPAQNSTPKNLDIPPKYGYFYTKFAS
jgi:hypothetical protein